MSASPSNVPQHGKTEAAEGRLPALDGVRGLAVFMVLVFHFWQGMHGLNLPPVLQQAMRLGVLGQKGVDLFFVLSGFLITGILIRTKGSPHYLRTFYVRRILRIFPLCYGVVFACLLAGWLFSLPAYSWNKCWWYLLYLQNVGMTFWPGTVGEPGHFWSLAVEEHFYFVWPFVVLLVPQRRLAHFAVGVIALAAVSRIVLLWAGYDVFTFTLCRMDALALGALLAVLFCDATRWTTITAWVRRLYGPAFLVGIPAFLLLSGTGNPVQQAVKYLAFAAYCGGLLILALDSTPRAMLPRMFVNPFLCFMGKISYAMYVFHPFLFGWLWRITTRPDWSPLRGHPFLSTVLDFVIAVGATLLAAWLSWILFESRILKLKERFEYQPARQREPAPRSRVPLAPTRITCPRA